MNLAKTTQLAALVAILPAAIATGCNAHPLKEVEYQTGGGIDLDDDGDESGDAGDDAADADAGDDAAEGEGGNDDDGLDGDDGSLDDDGDDGDDGEPVCTTQTIDVSANPPEVMLVLDKSGSMAAESWNVGGQQVRRWESLHNVVSGLLGTYDTSMNFGTVLFPALDATSNGGFEGACRTDDTVNIATASENAAAILGVLPGATEFNAIAGGTPARAGIELASANLAAMQTQGAKAMILVTDGLANCADENNLRRYDDQMSSAVTAAAANQIPTYVVGIDIRDEHDSDADANAFTELDAVARAGGVPASSDDDQVAFYDASDEDALYTALDDIAARVECTIALAEAAADDATVTIAVDGQDVAEVGDCTSQDGWHFTDANARNSIELCGAACDALRVTGEVQTTACEPGDTPDGGDIDPLPIP